MNQSVKYVGLDVHKDTIAVAVAEGDGRSEVREHGEIANTPAALTKLLGKLAVPASNSTFATRPGHVAMVSSVRWRRPGIAASWWLRR